MIASRAEDATQRGATAITMWDFSWLLRRGSGPGSDEGEYADLDRVLDELADRGYDTVRIDAFPHWIAADAAGATVESITALPQGETFMWGNHAVVEVRPREALADFLAGLRKRGLRVALSTWLTPDSSGRSEQVRTPQQLARVWIETLKFIARLGHLDLIDYVDLANEWPLFTAGPQQVIWPDGPPGNIWDGWRWSDSEVARIDQYAASLRAVREAHPGLRVLFSYCLRGVDPSMVDDCMRLSTDEYDLAEVHLWLSSTADFVSETEYTVPETWELLERHQHRIAQRYWTDRSRWLADLDQLMDRWRVWADERGLPIWTTECWGTVFWNPALWDPDRSSTAADAWAFIRDVAEHAVPRAVQLGWSGIATSNFSQPHHQGLWADRDWHRRMTDQIHAGSVPRPTIPKRKHSNPKDAEPEGGEVPWLKR